MFLNFADAHNAIMLRTGIFIAVNIPDSVKSAQGPSAMMKATSEARYVVFDVNE